MTAKPSVSCVFVCHDGAGRILLARRGAGARDEPGTWDCGAGALEFGETFEQAVAREVTEEYATPPLDVAILGVRNVVRDDPPSHWVAVVFAVRVGPASVAIGEPHKFDELRWFSPDALPSPLHSQLTAALDLYGKAWQMRLRMELFVDDLDASVEFWTSVLGFTLIRRDAGYTSLRRGEVVLGLGPVAKLPATGDGPGFTRSRLAGERGAGVEIVLEAGSAAEMQTLYDRCRAAGVVAEGLTDRPWGLRDFRITDPDGYYVRVTTVS